MKAGFWPDLPKMQKTIKDAGFKPNDDGVELHVSGKLVKAGEKLTLELDGMKSPVTFTLVAAKDHEDTFSHLEEKHLATVVEVTGQWQAPGEGESGPGTLAVTGIPKNKEEMKK